jgi:hypothetical protein
MNLMISIINLWRGALVSGRSLECYEWSRTMADDDIIKTVVDDDDDDREMSSEAEC